jgi:hypothetical protein
MGQLYKKWVRPTLLVGWIVVLTAGCGTPSHSPSPQAPTASPAGPQAPQVQFSPNNPLSGGNPDKRYVIAPELLNIIRVADVRLSKSDDGYLKIQVNVQNLTDTRQQFRYRIDWFNSYGDRLKIGDEQFTLWMLMPRETSVIAVTAPSPTAADCGIAFIPIVK